MAGSTVEYDWTLSLKTAVEPCPPNGLDQFAQFTIFVSVPLAAKEFAEHEVQSSASTG